MCLCNKEMAENKENKESKNETTDNMEMGFDLYPNRRSGKSETTWWEKLQEPSNAEISKTTCERNVAKAFERNPLLKLLKGALKKAGCPIDLKRHIVCEDCNSSVQGGYDAEYNQIVVCKNSYKARETPDTILFHELIHMYDNCANYLNFKNLEHLACTEIRAANLAHCSFLSSLLVGQSSPFDIKKTHHYCVKMRAAHSLVAARNIEFKTAVGYVTKVFDKCYNDLEPIGRRLRRKSYDSFLAYEEAKCFNISE